MVYCLTYMFFCWSLFVLFFFFKQKTAYDMRISDWSSDVCSSDLARSATDERAQAGDQLLALERLGEVIVGARVQPRHLVRPAIARREDKHRESQSFLAPAIQHCQPVNLRQTKIQDNRVIALRRARSEKHTSELQSLMRISSAV